MLWKIVELLEALTTAGMSSDEYDPVSGKFLVSQKDWRDLGVKFILRRLEEIHVEDRIADRQGGSKFRVRVDVPHLVSTRAPVPGLWCNIYAATYTKDLNAWELVRLRPQDKVFEILLPSWIAAR